MGWDLKIPKLNICADKMKFTDAQATGDTESHVTCVILDLHCGSPVLEPLTERYELT